MSKLLTIEEFEEVARAYKEFELEVLVSKQNDYGPYNIARCPEGPLRGVNVRIWDKMNRVVHLLNSGNEAANESLSDSYLDTGNYGTIARMVIDGVWPGLDNS